MVIAGGVFGSSPASRPVGSGIVERTESGNISEEASEVLDDLEEKTGETRAVLAREAFVHGLDIVERLWRERKHKLSPRPHASSLAGV